MNEYQAYAVWSVVASSVIFAIVIVWVYNKYISPAVLAAQATRNDEVAAAEVARDNALAELNTAREDQRKLEDSLAQMRLRSQNDAQRERERILQEARNEGDRVIRNAEGELDRARYAAKTAFRQSLVNRAVSRARDRAAREIDQQLDAKIVVDFANSLNKSNGDSFAVAGEAQHG